MKAESRNILQQRADEDARARREAQRQRRTYREGLARQRPLTHRPFADLFRTLWGMR